MEVSNIANNPIKFNLNGRDFLVKRLSILDLFAEFEVLAKEQFMDEVASYAKRIEDKQERIEYQRIKMKDMPKGKELQEIIYGAPGPKDANGNDTVIGGMMNTPKGCVKLLHLALSKCNEINMEEAGQIFSDPKNSSIINNIMNYITGADVDLNKEAPLLPKDAVKIGRAHV